MVDDIEAENSLPNTVAEIWKNWQNPEGAGPCAHCPRHWSQREDIPEQTPEPNNYGMNPWFAEGDYDPDVVVMGEEPGHHPPKPDQNLIGKPFKQTREDIRDVATEDSNSLRYLKPLFNIPYDEDSPTYWTNMTKCHPVGSNGNSKGQKECCGLSEDVERSYLREELEELSPVIVVSLGKPASENLLELYDGQISDFADSTMAGESLSGFHTRSNHTADFEITTAFHPNYRFDNDEFQARKPEIKHRQNQKSTKKSYYSQFGDDMVKWLEEYHEGTV